MAESNVKITLDTVRKNRCAVIYAVENDYGARSITATITADGKRYAVEKTAVVTINAMRRDGLTDAFSGEVNDDGSVTVPVTQWMLELEGEVICSVAVVTGETRLTTTHFYLEVQRSVWDGTSGPSADDPNRDVILEIIASETIRVEKEAARVSAETERVANENARIIAENERVSHESVRVRNESERVSAEDVRKSEFSTWQEEIGKISAFDKRIENLEAAVNPGLVSPMIDDTVAYVKDVPSGALPNAMISEIGGMTRKCTNLIPFPYVNATQTTNGITWTLNDDGTVTANGTATEPSYFAIRSEFSIENGDYCISGAPSEHLGNITIYVIYDNNTYATDYGNGQAFAISQQKIMYIGLSVGKGITVSNAVFKPILNIGSTPLPYEPYFEGLRDAKVTAIESVGVNLAYADLDVTNGGVHIYGNHGECVFNGVASGTISGNIVTLWLDAGTYTLLASGLNDNGADRVYFKNLSSTIAYPHTPSTVKVSNSGEYTLAYVVAGESSYSNKNIELALYKGTAFSSYIKPIKNSFTIPEAVQALDGYGWGVSAECHNKIVLDPASGVKKFVKNVGEVDLGTLEWVGSTSASAWTDTLYKPNSSVIYNVSSPFNTIYVDEYGAIIAIFDDGAFTSEAEVKSALSGIMLVYELATPIETDVSDYFGDDNFIGVEAGGTITAVNEYEYDAPSVMEYTIKGADAT